MQEVDRLKDVRTEIELAIAASETERARRLLGDLWREGAGSSVARYVCDRYERIAARVSLTPCRLAILRSFTVEPIVPMLRAAAFAGGIHLAVQVGDFNAYAQEIIAPDSDLYRFDPQVVILAVRTPDIAPELWRDFARLSDAEVREAIGRAVTTVRDLLSAFRARSNAQLVMHSLELPETPAAGILDAQRELGQADAIRQINREVGRLAREHRGVYLLDYDALIARHGRRAWHDERRWQTVRLPIAGDCLLHLAHEWLRFIHPAVGASCKVLVVDLDNTLWGGVIGEDGMHGIALGPDLPGAHYQALQRAVLDLYERGILIAVASKNNPADAAEALEGHPGMVLRPEHFTALRITWSDKAQSLREIAQELNVGTDALAFLDDNPVERQWVRSQLPEVTVIDLPAEPADYAATLRASPVFERLFLSAEDRERGRQYADQRLRAELQQGAASLEDFYRSLGMEMEIGRVTPETLARVAQLTQKTNQFNLTTRRCTEQQIAAIAAEEGASVYAVRVRDRFGDNGIVGVAITRLEGDTCEIDTFLLSCRVMGRTVETAILATIAEEARGGGAARLVGWFVATKKNAAAADVYRKHGFARVAEQHGESRWELDLRSETIALPPWIERRIMLDAGSGVATPAR